MLVPVYPKTMADSILGVPSGVGDHQHCLPYLGSGRASMVGRRQKIRIPTELETFAHQIQGQRSEQRRKRKRERERMSTKMTIVNS